MFNRNMKIFLGFIVVALLIVMTVFYLEIDSVYKIRVKDVDIAQVQDGVYTGEASSMLIHVKVEVRVKNSKIEDIKVIEYVHNRSEDALEMTSDVIDSNSLQVDNVSGATYSSIVLKSAIANALDQGVQK